ncbi:MAG: solute carrier family 26 protein [Myxococcota bacterium]
MTLSSITARIPLIGQLQERSSATLRSDVLAGLTTAIMLIPQAMAYAMLAGLDPIIGLYASTVPVALYAFLGTSRQLAVGPVAMVSMLVASGVAPIAGDDPIAYTGLAAMLALMVGVIQWGMGVARLGFLVRFLSHPVIAGFTAAAALIIGFSQLKHLLGISIDRSHHIHEILSQTIAHTTEIDSTTALISLISILTLVALKRFAPRVPRFLLVVAGGTLAVWGLGLNVAIVGDVPSGLPMPALPGSLGVVVDLLPIAITISLVSFMESISVARRFARENRYAIDADQELKALGLANVVGGVLQGYPVTGGFSRTAVNAQAGARTGLAGLVTAAAVGVTLMLLTPLFHFLPKGVLAAIIMTAVFGLVDVQGARHLWRLSRSDFWLMALTFFATLSLGIEQGIIIGVVASLLWFIWKTSVPHSAVLGRLPGTTVYRNIKRYPEAEVTEGVLVLRVDAPLYFANTAFLKRIIGEHLDEYKDTAHLILNAAAIGSVDAQAIDTIEEIVESIARREVRLWLAGVRGPVRDVLHTAGLWARIGDDSIVETIHDAMQIIDAPAALWKPGPDSAQPGSSTARTGLASAPSMRSGSAMRV